MLDLIVIVPNLLVILHGATLSKPQLDAAGAGEVDPQSAQWYQWHILQHLLDNKRENEVGDEAH